MFYGTTEGILLPNFISHFFFVNEPNSGNSNPPGKPGNPPPNPGLAALVWPMPPISAGTALCTCFGCLGGGGKNEALFPPRAVPVSVSEDCFRCFGLEIFIAFRRDDTLFPEVVVMPPRPPLARWARSLSLPPIRLREPRTPNARRADNALET